MSAAVINVNSMKIDDIKFDLKYQLVEDYDFFLRLIYKNDAYYYAKFYTKEAKRFKELVANDYAKAKVPSLSLFSGHVLSLRSIEALQVVCCTTGSFL